MALALRWSADARILQLDEARADPAAHPTVGFTAAAEARRMRARCGNHGPKLRFPRNVRRNRRASGGEAASASASMAAYGDDRNRSLAGTRARSGTRHAARARGVAAGHRPALLDL